MNFKILYFILSIFMIVTSSNAEEFKLKDNNTKFNIYSGMFDFSDHGKKSQIFGFQHQNEELVKESFLGTLSPVTGALITADNATYFYTGVQAQYKVGAMNVTPSFTPGLYHEGDGKDLGHILEFKSEVQLSLDLSKSTELGFSFHSLCKSFMKVAFAPERKL